MLSILHSRVHSKVSRRPPTHHWATQLPSVILSVFQPSKRIESTVFSSWRVVFVALLGFLMHWKCTLGQILHSMATDWVMWVTAISQSALGCVALCMHKSLLRATGIKSVTGSAGFWNVSEVLVKAFQWHSFLRTERYALKGKPGHTFPLIALKQTKTNDILLI